jgi:tetratricopeptide (TPR) repeat protein
MAIQTYSQARKYVRGNYLPHLNLMSLYTELAMHKRALEIAKGLRRVIGDDPMVLASIGAAYADEEKWDEAEELLSKAYEGRPPVASLYILLSFIYVDIFPDYKKSEEVLKYALSLDLPKRADLYNNLAHLYLSSNNIAEAKKVVNKLDLSSPISRATHALYLLKVDKYDDAVKEFNKAIDQALSDGLKSRIKDRMYFDLGNYFLEHDLEDRATSEFEKLENSKTGADFLKKSAEAKVQGFNKS